MLIYATKPPSGEEWEAKFLLERINYQSILAQKHNAKILAGPFAHRILSAKAELAQQECADILTNIEQSQKALIVDRYFELSSIRFRVQNYEDLLALKEDKGVREYARGFHNVLDQVVELENPAGAFGELMRIASGNESLAGHVSNWLSISCRVCTWLGMAPVLGSIPSAIGTVLDALKIQVDKYENRQSWYLLGPKASEVLLSDRIARR